MLRTEEDLVKKIKKILLIPNMEDRRRRLRKLVGLFYSTNPREIIPTSEYKMMLKIQGGKCAICFRVLPLFRDHDHETGVNRALLCHTCNTGLGLLQDSIEVVGVGT